MRAAASSSSSARHPSWRMLFVILATGIAITAIVELWRMATQIAIGDNPLVSGLLASGSIMLLVSLLRYLNAPEHRLTDFKPEGRETDDRPG